jgi:hypothetical protein
VVAIRLCKLEHAGKVEVADIAEYGILLLEHAAEVEGLLLHHFNYYLIIMEDCADCQMLMMSPKGKHQVFEYLAQRVIILTYGCLCAQGGRQQPSKTTAHFLGLPATTVDYIIMAHKRRGYIWRGDRRHTSDTGRPYKLNPQ